MPQAKSFLGTRVRWCWVGGWVGWWVGGWWLTVMAVDRLSLSLIPRAPMRLPVHSPPLNPLNNPPTPTPTPTRSTGLPRPRDAPAADLLQDHRRLGPRRHRLRPPLRLSPLRRRRRAGQRRVGAFIFCISFMHPPPHTHTQTPTQHNTTRTHLHTHTYTYLPPSPKQITTGAPALPAALPLVGRQPLPGREGPPLPPPRCVALALFSFPRGGWSTRRHACHILLRWVGFGLVCRGCVSRPIIMRMHVLRTPNQTYSHPHKHHTQTSTPARATRRSRRSTTPGCKGGATSSRPTTTCRCAFISTYSTLPSSAPTETQDP